MSFVGIAFLFPIPSNLRLADLRFCGLRLAFENAAQFTQGTRGLWGCLRIPYLSKSIAQGLNLRLDSLKLLLGIAQVLDFQMLRSLGRAFRLLLTQRLLLLLEKAPKELQLCLDCPNLTLYDCTVAHRLDPSAVYPL